MRDCKGDKSERAQVLVEAEIFNSAVKAYIEDGIIEVNLPEWSGRMSKAYALAELARLKTFIAKVESVLVEALCVPSAAVTDVTSERAELVEQAILEDDDDGEELDEWEEDTYGDDEWEDLEYDWDYIDYGDYLMSISDSQPLNHAGWRMHNKNWRRQAIRNGNRPYVAAYEFAPDIETFEGEIYRVINPRDLILHDDIPF